MKVLGNTEKGKTFETYMEQAKKSAEIYDVMLAEKLGGSQKNTRLLQKYQGVCAERNQAAHALKNAFSDRGNRTFKDAYDTFYCKRF